jgi:hypothetical protein
MFKKAQTSVLELDGSEQARGFQCFQSITLSGYQSARPANFRRLIAVRPGSPTEPELTRLLASILLQQNRSDFGARAGT